MVINIMEKCIQFHKDNANQAKLIFNNLIKLCNENSQSSGNPFFVPDINDENEFKEQILKREIDPKYITQLNELSEKIKFSKLLYYIYLYVGRNNIEFVLHEYTFFSINEIEERYNEMCNNNQHNICDIAFTYMGMGHVKVISIDLKSGKIFSRMDGGANGYDREDNHKFIISLDITKYQDKLHPLNNFLQNNIELEMINRY